jgi:ribosomal protein L11 methyltransferase
VNVPPPHPFRVLPPAAAAAGPRDLVVEASAFGGGTHPTTASCLDVLAALAPLDGLRVLDLGSGSGILGIAAIRLGAASALCVDVNPDAVACARRNGSANGVEDRLAHRLGGPADLAGEVFDLVVANVGGELLLDEAPAVAPLACAGGRLLLSGLLAGWAGPLERAYAALGCTALLRARPGEFCTLLLRRGRGSDRAPGPRHRSMVRPRSSS